jgi:hypothetical protein
MDWFDTTSDEAQRAMANMPAPKKVEWDQMGFSYGDRVKYEEVFSGIEHYGSIIGWEHKSFGFWAIIEVDGMVCRETVSPKYLAHE